MEVYNPAYDYGAMQEQARLKTIIFRLCVWIAATFIFGGWGGYLMYIGQGMGFIMSGILLLFCAATTAFLAICEIIDLTTD